MRFTQNSKNLSMTTKIKISVLSTIASLTLNNCANMQIRDPNQFNQALQYWNQSQQPIEMPRAPSTQPTFLIYQK